MTKQEFIDSRAAALRRARIVIGPALVLYLALFVGTLQLYQVIAPRGNGRSNPLVAAVVIALPTLSFGAALHWLNRRRVRRFGLICPACGKPLTEVIGQIAVATGRCANCGASVFEADAPTDSAKNQQRLVGGRR